MPAPAHLQRLQAIFVAGAEVKEPGAGRCEQPLVTVAAVEIATNVVHLERNHRWGMSAINHREDAAPPGSRAAHSSGGAWRTRKSIGSSASRCRNAVTRPKTTRANGPKEPVLRLATAGSRRTCERASDQN